MYRHSLYSFLTVILFTGQFREAYNLSLLHRLWEREEYRHCVKLLNMLSRRELTDTLQRAIGAVSGGQMAPRST